VTRMHLVALAALTSLAACGDPELEKRVADLENRVAVMEKAGPPSAPRAGVPQAQPPGAADAGPTASEADEAAADALFQQANELSDKGDYDGAKAKLAEMDQKYAATRAVKRAVRLKSELAVIGSDAGDVKVDKWYSSQQTGFDDGKATLVVFWETWCPHCQREVPKLEGTYEKFKPQGLNVIALTKVTRTSSDEKVDEFIKTNSLSFPVAKEDAQGSMSQRFGVQGIPAAAVIKNGKVVWRGHPARLTDEMLTNWLQG
jgi:thiol-disulfide isomerase/thioredoxin